jgi:ubiquinone/menaquinone biosynthesis C-methylase UbiE
MTSSVLSYKKYGLKISWNVNQYHQGNMTGKSKHNKIENQETDIEDNAQPSWLIEGTTDSKEVADYYDSWAKKYNEDLEEWDYRAPAYAAELLQLYVPQSQTILDAGCGTGLTGKALKMAGYANISGIDLSSTSLNIAEQLNVYNCLLTHDMQQPLPFSEDNFDALICVGVLTYIENSRSLFKEFCRIVRPGGYIVFSQRSDLFDSLCFRDIIASLEEERIWGKIKISKPQAYLPKNKDFTDKVQAIFCICKVL